MKYLYYILAEYKWNKNYHRIDTIEDQLDVESNPFNQTVYAPLKEIFRHFDGYGHVNMTGDWLLVLPSNTFYYEKKILIDKMTAPHGGRSINNNFVIPQEWIDINISLHSIDKYTLSMTDEKEGFTQLVNIYTYITYFILFLLLLWLIYYNRTTFNKIFKKYKNYLFCKKYKSR